MPDCLPRQPQLETQHSRAQSVGWPWLLCVLLFTYGALAATPTPAGDTNSPVAQALQKANKLFEAQQWDDALSRAEDFVAKTKGKFEEAVGERFLAGLYLTVPHHGTKRGTTFLRGQS